MPLCGARIPRRAGNHVAPKAGAAGAQAEIGSPCRCRSGRCNQDKSARNVACNAALRGSNRAPDTALTPSDEDNGVAIAREPPRL
jgi:hypothetical protein